MLLPVVAGCGWICYKVIAYAGGRVEVLQNQVRHLQQQLAAYQGGSAAAYAPPAVYAAGGGGTGTFSDVLFFPDPAMPCHFAGNCRRRNCTYAHQTTSLIKLLQVLGSAKRTLDVCVFTITCDEIADALIQAHQRGVRVRVISDNDQANTQGSDIDKMRKAGIPLKMDADQFHMHHKFAIIDGRLLINGSFNWTRQAVLYNQENCVIQDNPKLIRAFGVQFEALWAKYK